MKNLEMDPKRLEEMVNTPTAIDINKTTSITCEKCGNHTFERVVLLRKLSAIASPTGQVAIIPIPLFACNACGNINEEFLPKQKGGLVNEKF